MNRTYLDRDFCCPYFDCMSLSYPVVLIKSEEGYAIGCPALPGCWSQGATENEALDNIRSAIQDYLAAIRDSLKGADIREVEVAL
jgi:predicted RNase H-like HicB family nuclease